MVKVSHLEVEVERRALDKHGSTTRRKWPSGPSVLNPPLSALRGFLAAARLSCYCPTISKILHESHGSSSC